MVRDPREHPDAIIPDLTKPDPLLTFTKDQIAFVYGSKWKQRYFTKIADDYFPVLRIDADKIQAYGVNVTPAIGQALIRSITTRLWPMGDETAFVPGHGPMSTFAHERATNPLVGDRVLAAA